MDSRASFERLSTDQSGFLLHEYPPFRPESELSDGERPEVADEGQDYVRVPSPAASSTHSRWSAMFEGLSASHTTTLALQTRPGSEQSNEIEQHPNGENYVDPSQQSLLPDSDATLSADQRESESASGDGKQPG